MPTRKVSVSALAGGIVTILVWALGYWKLAVVPPEIAAAATIVVSTLVGYFVPEAEQTA